MALEERRCFFLFLRLLYRPVELAKSPISKMNAPKRLETNSLSSPGFSIISHHRQVFSLVSRLADISVLGVTSGYGIAFASTVSAIQSNLPYKQLCRQGGQAQRQSPGSISCGLLNTVGCQGVVYAKVCTSVYPCTAAGMCSRALSLLRDDGFHLCSSPAYSCQWNLPP